VEDGNIEGIVASKALLNSGLANKRETSVVCEVYDALQAFVLY